MCGIAGIVHRDPGQPVDPATVRRMTDAIRHRGPDDEGVWIGPGVGLGHRRLSIIDLSPAGHQPMTNEDETVWVVFNGEVYNFAELRKDLLARGHRFRGDSDTEVIAHLYEEEGVACVEKLEGMFAFALWDERERRLLLARDRVGKKPLKYAEVDGGLLFASELKGLLASGRVDRDVDLRQVHHYLSFGNVPAPATGFAKIQKLEPGHRLVWERGSVRVDRYWELDYREKRTLPVPEWRDAVRQAVQGAVERRLVADVPLGAFLSGGIDSSIVVACMARASSRPVETFSIGFRHETLNELPHARLVAERWQTSHHEFVVEADSVSLLPKLARLYEEPYADSSAVPSWFLARETRQHVTVALNGDGGDEGFGGYSRYAQFQQWRARAAWLRPLRPVLGALASLPGLPPQRARQLDVAAGLVDADAGAAYAWLLRLCSDREKQALYVDPAFAAGMPASRALISRWYNDPRAGREPIDRLTFTDVMSYLPDDLLVKMDLATMAHSLEARSPLLDPAVLALAASAPQAVRTPDGRLKGLLKDAFRDDLPSELIDRPKSGFGLPIQDWFRGSWGAFARDHLLGADSRVGAYLEKATMRRFLDEHQSGAISRGYQLYALLMLELWHREIVDADPASLAAA